MWLNSEIGFIQTSRRLSLQAKAFRTVGTQVSTIRTSVLATNSATSEAKWSLSTNMHYVTLFAHGTSGITSPSQMPYRNTKQLYKISISAPWKYT